MLNDDHHQRLFGYVYLVTSMQSFDKRLSPDVFDGKHEVTDVYKLGVTNDLDPNSHLSEYRLCTVLPVCDSESVEADLFKTFREKYTLIESSTERASWFEGDVNSMISDIYEACEYRDANVWETPTSSPFEDVVNYSIIYRGLSVDKNDYIDWIANQLSDPNMVVSISRVVIRDLEGLHSIVDTDVEIIVRARFSDTSLNFYYDGVYPTVHTHVSNINVEAERIWVDLFVDDVVFERSALEMIEIVKRIHRCANMRDVMNEAMIDGVESIIPFYHIYMYTH